MKLEKFNVKELITVGVLASIYIVIYFTTGVIGGLNPLLFIGMQILSCIPVGIIFILMLNKVKKVGNFTITGIMLGSLMFATGHFWCFILLIILSGIISDLYYYFVDKTKFLNQLIAYTIYMCLTCFSGLITMKIFADVYRNKVASQNNGVYIEWFETMLSYLNFKFLLVIGISTIICSLIGAILGQKMLNKHFIKSGIA